MMVLHPFSSHNIEGQGPTWRFLDEIRGSRNEVIDRDVSEPMAYCDFLKEYWGRQDLIVIEADKEPTLDDFHDLVSCGRLACAFPYPISFYFYTPMSLWRNHFPFSLGFVKFTKEVQEGIPSSLWYSEGKHWGLDGMIERPMIEKYGPMHLHEKMIRHNHNKDLRGRLGGLKYQVLQAVK